MDYTLVIGLLVVLVVGFFAYQWMSKRPTPIRRALMAAAPPSLDDKLAPARQVEVKQEQFPEIAGQTQQEALMKEPIQRREPSSQQEPVLNDGQAPAQFDQQLRHPEQLFHQPSQQAANPTMQITDVPSGRASMTSTPLGPVPVGSGQQGFAPEMAQNGGAFLGNSVFAYDGMEPTDFTSF
jgi:hypothetical protein